MALQRIGLSWPLSGMTGWGIFGLNLVLELIRRGDPLPLLLTPPALDQVTAGQANTLAPFAGEQVKLMEAAQSRGPGMVATLNEVLMLHALGNGFVWGEISGAVQGKHNVGFIFFEETRLDEAALERARKFDRVLVGSTWNEEVLVGLGLDHVAKVLQGIDPARFFPRPKRSAYGDRFVIFSGGKLEPRKGQDIVLAAFRAFHEKHADALLVTAWQNAWPELARQIEQSPHVEGAPEDNGDGTIAVAEWAQVNGVPADAILDLGWIDNDQLPDVLGEAHVALFPNRGEGGTNLAAMEAMACGIPCILSSNTGHLDLIEDDRCYPLRQQTPVEFGIDFPEDWRDSSIDEILECLETAYTDHADAMIRGQRGADFMRGLSWRAQTEKLVENFSDLMAD